MNRKPTENLTERDGRHARESGHSELLEVDVFSITDSVIELAMRFVFSFHLIHFCDEGE